MDGDEKNADEEAAKALSNKKLIFLVFLSAQAIGGTLYIIDNYKFIAMPIVKNDALITTAFSISSFFAILS